MVIGGLLAMQTFDSELFKKVNCELGEGPVWDCDKGNLYWVDILGKKVYSYNNDMDSYISYDTPSYVSCLAIGEDSKLYIMLENGLHSLDIESGELTFISKPSDHPSTHRFNDGKCDRHGRFYVASMNNNLNDGSGEMVPTSYLYFIDECGVFHKATKEQFIIANGMAWNEEDDILYHVESAEKTVKAYKYDKQTGDLGESKVIIQFDGRDGVPDGMTIDNEGMLWIAHWGGYKVSRWNPRTSECIGQISVPAKYVTSCTFGGVHRDQLFITTARNNSDDELAGSVFCSRVSVGGLEANKFRIRECK